MAILSTLLSVSEPSGFWITIIKAFEAVTNNYVLAIIFLTVVIRVIWGLVDIFSKYSQQKMNAMQAKMQPELEKIKAKYANQPQVMQQKQNELYRRNYGRSYYGSCIIMLVVMILNLVIFFTLFAGLNSMAAYKISANYDNLKYNYENCLNVVNEYVVNNYDGDYNNPEVKDLFSDYENLEFIVETNPENGEQNISLVRKNGEQNEVVYTCKYSTDFSRVDESVTPSETPEGEQPQEAIITSNEYIISILNKIFPVYEEGEEIGSKEIVLIENYQPELDAEGNQVVDAEGNPVYKPLYLSQAIQNIAMNRIENVYDANKDSFLWIENIWFADSPFQDSIVDYGTLKSQIGSANIEEGEEQIYNAFMVDLKDAKNRVNGYYILPILCVLVAVLSMYVNTLYNKIKNKKKGITPVKQNGKWAQIIIPVLLGIFALFYNSVFAIYMLVSQLVATILTPLQLFIVDKIIDKTKKKEEDKVTVDYSRKF